MLKEKQIKLTEEIIDTAYSLLTQKLAFGGLSARNESAFQLEFGHILKTIGQLYEFRLVDKFHLEFETYISLNESSIKSRSTRARVDLLIKYQDEHHTTKAAIELKFFKKENHREPNNRYDVFKDISNLELYKSHGIDFVILSSQQTIHITATKIDIQVIPQILIFETVRNISLVECYNIKQQNHLVRI